MQAGYSPVVAAQLLSDEAGQLGVAEVQPAAGGHTVGLVLELAGKHLVEVVEQLVLDNLRVDGGHTVDLVGAHHCQVGHVHQPVCIRVDGRSALAHPR